MPATNIFFRTPLEELRQIVADCRTTSQVFRRLGLSRSGVMYRIFQRTMDDLGISTSHFDGSHPNGPGSYKRQDDVFKENSLTCPSTIKLVLKRTGLLPYKCVICSNDGHWQSQLLTLQIDHINGVNNDHRIENLRWLCPNCHTQTPTYGGKARGKLRQNKMKLAIIKPASEG